MAKYIAQTPIRHARKRYAVGDAIELTVAEAKPLLADGAVIPQPANAKEPPPPPPPPPAGGAGNPDDAPDGGGTGGAGGTGTDKPQV